MLKKFLLSLLFLTTFLVADAPTREQIAKIYVATYNRAPDAGGLEYWNNSGLSRQEIAKFFFDSSETTETYPPGSTTRDFVKAVYQNLFNRAPDAGGWTYWADQIDKGNISRSFLILFAIDTDDAHDAGIMNNKTEVALAYVDLLGSITNIVVNDPSEYKSNPAYLASIKIISGVTEDVDTVNTALNFLENIEESEDPVGDILGAAFTLIEAYESYTKSIASVQQKMVDAIGALSSDFTEVIDDDSLTVERADAFYDKLKLMETDIVNIVFLEHQITSLMNNEDWVEGTVQPRSFTLAAIVIGYIGYQLYEYGTYSKKKLYDSTEYLIVGAENSGLLNQIKATLNLPQSATRSEVQAKYNQLTSNKESISRTLIDDARTYYSLDSEDAINNHKKNVVKVAIKGADTAFKSTAAGYLAVASSGSINAVNLRTAKINSSFGPNTGYAPIPNTTGVTIELTAPAVTGAGAVAVEVMSKEKEEKRIPKPESTMTREEALRLLQKIKDGVISEFNLKEIGDALKAVYQQIAKSNGATVEADGTVVIDVPKKSQTIYVDKEHSDENMVAQKSGASDVVVVREEKKPVTVQDVDMSQDTVVIKIPVQPPYAVPDSREFTENIIVSLRSPDDVYIVYSLYGGIDWGEWTLYSDPFIFTETASLAAYADLDPWDDDAPWSEIRTFTYTKKEPMSSCPLTYDASLDKDGEHKYTIYAPNDIHIDCWYYGSGQLKQENPFDKENRFQGLALSYWENGLLSDSTPYTHGKINGISKRWHDNGQLAETTPYDNNVLNGVWRGYFRDGTPFIEVYYVDGKRDGTFKEWFSDGELCCCEIYKNDVYVSDC